MSKAKVPERRIFHLTTEALRCGSYAQTLQFCAGSPAGRRVLTAA
jgi:hypothetical protein